MQIWEALDRLTVVAARLDAEGIDNKRKRDESDRREVTGVWGNFVDLCSGRRRGLWYLRFTLSEFDAMDSGTLEYLVVSGVFSGNILLIGVRVFQGVITLEENTDSVFSGSNPSDVFNFLEKKYDRWSREGEQLRTWDEFTYLARNQSGNNRWQLTDNGVTDPGHAGVVSGRYMYGGNVEQLVLGLAVVVESGAGNIQVTFDSFGEANVQEMARGCRKVGTPTEVLQFLNNLYPKGPEDLVVPPGSPGYGPVSPQSSPRHSI
jgi:hypothetical protein